MTNETPPETMQCWHPADADGSPSWLLRALAVLAVIVAAATLYATQPEECRAGPEIPRYCAD